MRQNLVSQIRSSQAKQNMWLLIRGTLSDMATTEGVFKTFFDSCVRGYHVYQEEWDPVLGKTLPCTCELGNAHCCKGDKSWDNHRTCA